MIALRKLEELLLLLVTVEFVLVPEVDGLGLVFVTGGFGTCAVNF
jgi:hypothetical protein